LQLFQAHDGQLRFWQVHLSARQLQFTEQASFLISHGNDAFENFLEIAIAKEFRKLASNWWSYA